MQLHKNQDGFTLVELAVGILVSSIVLFFATSMILSANSLFMSNRDRSEAKQIGDAVFSYIVDELTYAQYIRIFPDFASVDDLGGASSRALTVSGGMLHNEFGDIFGEGFYLGYTVEFTAKEYSAYHLVLSVTVLNKDGSEVYSTASTIKALNMPLLSMDISDIYDSAGGSSNPYITYDNPGD